MTDDFKIPEILSEPPNLDGERVGKPFVRRKITVEEKFRAQHMDKCWKCFCLTSSYRVYRCRNCISRGIPIPAKFFTETKSGS